MKKVLQWFVPILFMCGLVQASNITTSKKFNDLIDVSVGSPTDEDVAAFNSASGDWENTADKVTEDYLLYRQEQIANIDGGTCTSGSYQTRVITDEVVDTGNHGTLSSNQITLLAGTYRIRAHSPAFAVNSHKTRLQNVTDATTTIVGTSEFSDSSVGESDVTSSFIEGRFTIASSKAFEIQHRCQTTNSGDGFGMAANLGEIEVYNVVEFWREGSGPTTRGFSGALVSKSSAQSVVSDVVLFQVEAYDTDSWHDNVTNNSRMTVPTGVTRVQACGGLEYSSNNTGLRQLGFLLNGSFVVGSGVLLNTAVAGSDILMACSGVFSVVATDFIELRAVQNSGDTVNVVASVFSYFSIRAIE